MSWWCSKKKNELVPGKFTRVSPENIERLKRNRDKEQPDESLYSIHEFIDRDADFVAAFFTSQAIQIIMTKPSIQFLYFVIVLVTSSICAVTLFEGDESGECQPQPYLFHFLSVYLLLVCGPGISLPYYAYHNDINKLVNRSMMYGWFLGGTWAFVAAWNWGMACNWRQKCAYAVRDEWHGLGCNNNETYLLQHNITSIYFTPPKNLETVRQLAMCSFGGFLIPWALKTKQNWIVPIFFVGLLGGSGALQLWEARKQCGQDDMWNCERPVPQWLSMLLMLLGWGFPLVLNFLYSRRSKEAMAAMTTDQQQYDQMYTAVQQSSQPAIELLEELTKQIQSRHSYLYSNKARPPKKDFYQTLMCYSTRDVRQSESYDAAVLYEIAMLCNHEFSRLIQGCADQGACNAVAHLSPVKSAKRAIQKCVRSYHGDASRLVDVVRASIEFDSLDDLYRVLKLIDEDHQHLEVIRIKNRFSPSYNSAASAGYRDVALNVRVLEYNYVCEVQLHLASIYKLKSDLAAGSNGHARYTAMRNARAT